MSTRMARTARGTFAALVAVGLTWGAGTALASPVAASACAFDPSRGWIGASCTTNAYCTQVCTSFYGYSSPGKCLNGCCTCLF